MSQAVVSRKPPRIHGVVRNGTCVLTGLAAYRKTSGKPIQRRPRLVRCVAMKRSRTMPRPVLEEWYETGLMGEI